jgi:probable phosphoglycerate mutase
MSRVIGARWVGLPVEDGARLRLDTAAVSVLGWERSTPVLHRWNDTGELPGA